jgi:hypothetical protein
MKSREHNLQVATVQLLRANKIFCFAVPNGGRRDAITGANLKKEGVLAGVSDLIILKHNKVFFVEMKDGKNGRQSQEQKYFEQVVTSYGFKYLIWRTPEDVMKFIKEEKGDNNG